MAFSKRWPTGFTDSDGAKPCDAQALNAIETALLALFDATPGSTGMAPTWNGSKYVPKLVTNAEVDAAAAIAYTKLALAGTIVNTDLASALGMSISKLAGYPADATKFLRGDGSWTAPSVVGFGTSLPGSPSDGDEYVYIVDATNGIFWRLKYKTSLAKWVFLSGRPLRADVLTAQNQTNNTYQALGTAGPIITLPLAGSYDITLGTTVSVVSTSFGATPGRMSFDIGATGAVDADSILIATRGTFSRKLPTKTGLTASTALTAKYKSDNTVVMTFENRWIEATPAIIG